MSYRFPVERGHVVMFARAIGDQNPEFLGTNPAEPGVERGCVPPTFLAAGTQFDPDYPMRPQPGEAWIGDAQSPEELPDTGGILLAERHFEYVRPVRVGDILTVSTREGREWLKSGSKGTLRFNEIISEYRDEAGELVATQTTISVKRLPATEDPS